MPFWIRAEPVVFRSLAGTCVLRHRETGETAVLRGATALVWIGLEVPGTTADLVEDVLGVVPECLEDDVLAGLARLVELEFVLSAGVD